MTPLWKDMDADEIEIWRRHPATKWLLKTVADAETVGAYRAATDMLSLGRAQGMEAAFVLIRRHIEK